MCKHVQPIERRLLINEVSIDEYKFNWTNPTGHWRLNLENPTQLFVMMKLISINATEGKKTCSATLCYFLILICFVLFCSVLLRYVPSTLTIDAECLLYRICIITYLPYLSLSTFLTAEFSCKRSGRDDTSQDGNWFNFRNAKVITRKGAVDIIIDQIYVDNLPRTGK